MPLMDPDEWACSGIPHLQLLAPVSMRTFTAFVGMQGKLEIMACIGTSVQVLVCSPRDAGLSRVSGITGKGDGAGLVGNEERTRSWPLRGLWEAVSHVCSMAAGGALPARAAQMPCRFGRKGTEATSSTACW